MSTKTQALKDPIGRLETAKPLCVEPNTTLKDAYARMKREKTGCALVCRGKKIVGIFTDRDLLMRAIGDFPPDTPIEKAMSSDPVLVTAKTTVGEAVELMHSRGFRNLPLVDDKKEPVGLLTVRQIIKYLAAHYPVEVYNLPPKPDQVDAAPDGA